jgi:hypothetical protein
MHFINPIGLKNVVVPSFGWSQVVKEFWVADDRTRGESIRSNSVFVKGQASAERADTGKAGRDEPGAKIEELTAHLIIRWLAPGVKVDGRWRLNFDKEHGMVLELHGEHRNNVDCTLKLMDDFERAVEVKKVI